MNAIKSHKDLDVWKAAMNLAKGVYSLTTEFPGEERYGLVSQMKRAVISIPSNIAEGAARDSQKEFIRFLYTSLGSLAELETQLLLSKEFGFVEDTRIYAELDRIRMMLFGLIRHLRNRDSWPVIRKP